MRASRHIQTQLLVNCTQLRVNFIQKQFFLNTPFIHVRVVFWNFQVFKEIVHGSEVGTNNITENCPYHRYLTHKK